MQVWSHKGCPETWQNHGQASKLWVSLPWSFSSGMLPRLNNDITSWRVAEPGSVTFLPSMQIPESGGVLTDYSVWDLATFTKIVVGELHGLSSDHLISRLQSWQRCGEITCVLVDKVTWIIVNGYMANPVWKHLWWALPTLQAFCSSASFTVIFSWLNLFWCTSDPILVLVPWDWSPSLQKYLTDLRIFFLVFLHLY